MTITEAGPSRRLSRCIFWTEVVGLREEAERAKCPRRRGTRKVDRLEAELARATSVPVIDAETGAETREPAPKRARDAPGGGLSKAAQGQQGQRRPAENSEVGTRVRRRVRAASRVRRVHGTPARRSVPTVQQVVCASCATDSARSAKGQARQCWC